MSKWLWALILFIQAHFAASYLVPLEEKDQGAFGGLLKWVWPWGVGNKGFLGEIAPNQMAIGGFWIAAPAAVLSILAILAVLGLWVPHAWWRGLAIAGAAIELLLMIGFLGPTKVLPILFDLAVIVVVWTDRLPVRLT